MQVRVRRGDELSSGWLLASKINTEIPAFVSSFLILLRYPVSKLFQLT